jgi:tetratricopeptide (TPR) repeat protein
MNEPLPLENRVAHDRKRYEEAERMLRGDQWADGLAILIQLAEQGSPLWEVYNDLAVAALQQNEITAALDLLENAAMREPAPGVACRNLAAFYRWRGAGDKAIAQYARLLAAYPEDGDARTQLTHLLASSAAAAENALRPAYERRPPSAQTIIDIFGSSWKSALPGEANSGRERMFDDRRPAWFASQLPGGLHFKSILELGPFEGYQTYLLDQLGAREIVSVEGNTFNFLKCLCLKELYGLCSRLHLGDLQAFLDSCDRRFDAVFASGVLYHMQTPVHFIERATRLADHLYLWTHYYDASIARLTNGQEKHFVPEKNIRTVVGDRELVLYARSYLMQDYRNNIPRYWEGGQEDLTYWLAKDDLFAVIRAQNFEIAAVESEGNVNGLPCISLYARRLPA